MVNDHKRSPDRPIVATAEKKKDELRFPTIIWRNYVPGDKHLPEYL